MRTGFKTFLRVAHRLCRLFATWGSSIDTAIEASQTSAENKAKMRAAKDAIQAACAVVDVLATSWE